MNLQMDAFSYQKRVRTIPPLYKMAFAFLLGAIAFLSHKQVQFVIFIGVCFFLVAIVKIPTKFLIKWISIPTAFLLLSLPAILLGVANVNHNNQDLYMSIFIMGDWQVFLSKKGMELAASAIYRSMSLFICMFALFVTTPFHEILQGLAKLRVPQVVLDLLLSMYRYIFILMQYGAELNMVMKSRQGNVTWKRSLHSLGFVFVQLFLRTFEKYKQMSLVIESRGFTEQIFFHDDKKTAIPKKFTGFGAFMLLLLIGLEMWWRNN